MSIFEKRPPTFEKILISSLRAECSQSQKIPYKIVTIKFYKRMHILCVKGLETFLVSIYETK
jgi:hypothetical protein